MGALARFIVSRGGAWAIVLVVLALAPVSLMLARQVENEDDILAFLPQDNPEVRVFSDINKRFGGLDVALVGIQAKDIFTGDFLRRLRGVTRELSETKGLDHVLSLGNIVDFTSDPEKGGVVSAPLVEHIPKSAAEQQALRRKVMSRDHVVGNLVAADGKAVLVYCYLAYGTDPKTMAARIQDTVRRAFPDNPVFWGGGPFISTYIYNTTQRDMQRLTPWAVLAIVVIMVLAFRDIIGSCLALISTAIGIVFSLGLMGFCGVRFNIVLSSMPVILFAIGSAYGIHVLARYYALMERSGGKGEGDACETAITQTLTSVGPTVVAAGLTTAAGLLSFMFMDIRPIRTFGLFTALGILFTLLLSLTFIPAVTRLAGLKRRQSGSLLMRKLMVRCTVFAGAHRWGVGLVLAGLAVVGLAWAIQVDSRMDHATFFSKGSPPDRAERFLRDRFGGSQFIQVQVKGDMNDPEVLRELQQLADRIALMPNVASVLQVGMAIGQINEVLVGQRRIPETRAQVKLLYAFLAGDPTASQLVTADRSRALMHIKVSSNLAADLEPLLASIERLTAEDAVGRYRVVRLRSGAEAADPAVTRRARRVSLRIQAVARQLFPAPLDGDTVSRLDAALRGSRPTVPVQRVIPALVRFLRSEECAVELPPAAGEKGGDPAERVARTLAELGPGPAESAVVEAVARALERDRSDSLVQDLALSLSAPLEEVWRTERARLQGAAIARAARIQVPPGARGKRFQAGMTMALLDLDRDRVMLPAGPADRAGGALAFQVNGLPVMHRGLSRSVEGNQIKSVAVAVFLIVVIMALIFRSLLTGLLVAAPTLFTLLVIYGGMGLLGVRLDIGTSMLASLILGAGVDYAVHLTAAWYAPPDAPAALRAAAARAADRTGPAIWTNAVMVCAGFLVLATGEARPLQNVGGLTGAAMITAAVATFLIVPVLARRTCYSRHAESLDSENDSEAVEAVLGKASSEGHG